MNKVVILGGGYIGKTLSQRLQDTVMTYRSGSGDIFFSFDDERSWNNLPQADIAIITFPLLEFSLLKKFKKKCLDKYSKIFLYSTTSIYADWEGLITESSFLDKNHQRYEGEKYLLEKGVNIFTLSGICGEGRKPKDWLLKGSIKNGNKIVNLIHRDDIVNITIELLNENLKGERVNLTAGGYYWKDIAKELGVDITFEQKFFQKRIISNEKLLALLGGTYNFLCPYRS